MLCNEAKELMQEYIFDELEVNKKNEIANHIENCKSCREEYETLKILLIDNTKELRSLKASITLPTNIEDKVLKRHVVKKNAWFSKGIAAACFLLMLFYAVPVAAYYVGGNLNLNKYADFDKDLEKYFKEGKLEVINKSCTMKNVTFKIDGLIREPDKTVILYTFKADKNKNFDYAFSMGGNFHVEDQFGHTYRIMEGGATTQSAMENGETTAYTSIEPLKFYTSKLNIRVTDLESGKLIPLTELELKNRQQGDDFKYKVQEGRSIYGKWEVGFYVNKKN